MQMRARFRFSTKMAGELATQLARGTVEPLYAQIDPNRIGEMQRAIQIAHEYGQRLNAYSKNLKEGSLKKLVAGYPSHSFVIDRKEAKELFNHIPPLIPHEEELIKLLWFAMREELELVELLRPSPTIEERQQEENSNETSANPAEQAPAAEAGLPTVQSLAALHTPTEESYA